MNNFGHRAQGGGGDRRQSGVKRPWPHLALHSVPPSLGLGWVAVAAASLGFSAAAWLERRSNLPSPRPALASSLSPPVSELPSRRSPTYPSARSVRGAAETLLPKTKRTNPQFTRAITPPPSERRGRGADGEEARAQHHARRAHGRRLQLLPHRRCACRSPHRRPPCLPTLASRRSVPLLPLAFPGSINLAALRALLPPEGPLVRSSTE